MNARKRAYGVKEVSPTGTSTHGCKSPFEVEGRGVRRKGCTPVLSQCQQSTRTQQ